MAELLAAMYCAQIGYSLNKLLLLTVLAALLIGLEISHIHAETNIRLTLIQCINVWKALSQAADVNM